MAVTASFWPMSAWMATARDPRSTSSVTRGRAWSLGPGAAAGLAIVDDQVCAGLAERPRNDPPQATRAAGDQRYAAVTGSHSMSLVPHDGSGQRAARPGWVERWPELMAGTERCQAERCPQGRSPAP